ncbi:MAG: response regulator transcription factor [Oscillospiraceae bacterium]|nr:response regulator transcription factor [Oscillospiraceae bacterium]
MAYKVLVVDDQKLSRQLFSLMIENSPNYELLYELESASVAYIYCAKYTVDLVIMDIVMADGSTSLDEAKRIKTSFPDIKILAVTSMPEVSYLKKARAAGIDSFWYKEADDITLLEIMDLTMQGESIYPDHTPELTIGNAKSYDFTPSEIRVLREMTTGASNNEIAEKLFIDVTTVKKHITNMLQKTGFKNRTELAIEARVHGLVIGRKEDEVDY